MKQTLLYGIAPQHMMYIYDEAIIRPIRYFKYVSANVQNKKSKGVLFLMITIKEIVMDHVARKIADRIYWYMNRPLDVTKGDIDTLVNFYYDDEIVQLIKNDISSYTKIMDQVKELYNRYD